MTITREQVIEMARDADIIDFRDEADDPHVKQMVDMLMHVVGKAAAAEREECAKLEHGPGIYTKHDMAEAIRARGSK